jgi:hypothetical protein
MYLASLCRSLLSNTFYLSGDSCELSGYSTLEPQIFATTQFAPGFRGDAIHYAAILNVTQSSLEIDGPNVNRAAMKLPVESLTHHGDIAGRRNYGQNGLFC